MVHMLVTSFKAGSLKKAGVCIKKHGTYASYGT